MEVSEIIALLAVQFNSPSVKKLSELLTEEECATRMLCKSTLAELKRLCPRVSSPRLSKVLISLGLPEKAVSLALSTPTADTLPRVSEELDDLLQMGDSRHFTSCQATGNGLRQVEELIPYLGEHLFLWLLGERKSISKDGFKARALLRVMYSDKEYTQPAGLYIDRPYGQSGTLLLYLAHLKKWWDNWSQSKGFSTTPVLMPPVWQRDDGGGNDFQHLHGGLYPQFLYCPSAEGGYNDTLTHQSGPYDCFSVVDLTVRNLHQKAYRERPWECGVYLCSLREHVYNAQKCAFIAPPPEKEPRGKISPMERGKVKKIISILGYPSRGSFKRVWIPRGRGIAFKFSNQKIALVGSRLYSLQPNGEWLAFYEEKKDSLVVYQNLPELGFWRAEEIPEPYEPFVDVEDDDF